MMRPLGCNGPGILVGASVEGLVGGETPPERADLSPLFTEVTDQRGQSCFGHAWAGAIRTQSSMDLDPSNYASWTLARAIETPDPQAALRDVGVFGHDMLDVLRDFGVVARRRWPDDMPLSSRVTQNVIEAGLLAKLGDVHGIEETGEDLKRRIQQTVGLAKQCVVFGMLVSKDYMDLWGTGWKAPKGPPLGGHAQHIDAYTQDFVGVRNSWGKAWGANGRVWIPWDAFLALGAFDFQTARFLPTRLL